MMFIPRIRQILLKNSNIINFRTFCSRKMCETAVIRSVDSEDFLTLSFVYENEELGIKKRQYNFQRNKNEQWQIARTRILTNIERISNKKSKNKKTVNNSEKEEFHLPISITKHETTFSDDMPCCQAFTEGAKLQIGNTIYNIKLNPPMLTSVTLPSNIMAGFFIFPKIEIEFAEKSDCGFQWFRSTNIVKSQAETDSKSTQNVEKVKFGFAENWEKVGDSMCYATTVDDIGRQIRLICEPRLPSGESGFAIEALSSVAVSPGPGLCPFEKRHEFTKDRTSHGSFRMVSYNILADLYADSDFSRETLFPTCPPYALSIDYRKQLLIKELLGYNSDIICLQEVDKKVFDCDLKPAFELDNMTGMLNLKGGQVAEGLACVYRNNKFKLIDRHSIILAEALKTSPFYENILKVINENEKLADRILNRTTALQVVTLASLEVPNRILCVGNTHLYFHPDADHVRLLQTAVCLLHLQQVVELTKLQNPNCDVAVILSGDFNSTPEFGVFQFLETQYIPEDHMDWLSNAEQAVRNLSLSHPFVMESACGTPAYTNFTTGFVGCLDYIFIEREKMQVERVIPFPSDEDIKQHVALPSVTMPSDHIALVCDLKFSSFDRQNVQL